MGTFLIGFVCGIIAVIIVVILFITVVVIRKMKLF